MESQQWNDDVASFKEILHHIIFTTNDYENDESITTTVFKSKYIINTIKVQEESIGPTTLHGLHDVVYPFSLGRRLVLVSKVREWKSSIYDGNNSDSYYDCSKDSSRDEDLNVTPVGESVATEVVISSQNIVRAGPPSISFIYYVDRKINLQSVGGISKEQCIDIDGLYPVELTDARYLLAVYIHAIRQLRSQLNIKNNIPWLMIKCDEKSPRETNLIISTVDLDDNGGALQGIFRSFVMKDCMGDINSLTEFKKLQERKSPMFFMSRYYLLGSKCSKSEEDENTSTLMLEFAWKETTLPLDPPPLSADAVAKFKIISSDPCSPLAAVYQELDKLSNIVKGKGFSDFSAIPTTSDEKTSIVDFIPSFLEGLMMVKNLDKTPSKQDDKAKDLVSPLLSFVLDGFKRNDVDFTDKLWDFIKNARSLEEVVVCLDHIFAAVCTREVQPVFSPENKTKLAMLIREFYKTINLGNASEALQDKLSIILENSEQLMVLLADIGIEKFRKDYTSFFVNVEWATFGQLEPIINNADSLEERMSCIWKLHHCLELVSIGKAYLNLKIDHLRILSRAGLEFYKNNDSTKTSPLFSISIPSVSASAQALNELCQGMKPETWKVTSINSSEDTDNLAMLIVSEYDGKTFNDTTKGISLQESPSQLTVLNHTRSISESRVKVF